MSYIAARHRDDDGDKKSMERGCSLISPSPYIYIYSVHLSAANICFFDGASLLFVRGFARFSYRAFFALFRL